MEDAKNPERSIDIHKAALIIIRDRKLLLSRSKGKKIFVAPGGKLEDGEDAIAAAIREIDEEQGLVITDSNLEFLDTFYADAAGLEADPKWLQMDVFFLRDFEGEPTAQGEIAENLWYDTSMTHVLQGSIFEHYVIPELKRRDLID